MFRIYISSKFANGKKVREFARQLEQAGHTITLDWTSHTTVEKKDEGYSADPKEAQKQALECIDAIRDCDVFILHYEKEPEGTGRFVELGAALALNKKVLLFGKNLDQKLFFFHPNILKMKTFDKTVEKISELDR